MSELRQLVLARAERNEPLRYHGAAWCTMIALGTIFLVSSAGGSRAAALPQVAPALVDGGDQRRQQHERHDRNPAPPLARKPVCGDDVCEPPFESMDNCMADCPGVTTQPQCGEEPHSDPGGYAVVWGAGHKKASAAECCEACMAHAADPKNAKRPCNSWVYCHAKPYCWSLDTGNWHGPGECWLKWQANPQAPLYGQRGKFTHEFRKKHWYAHKTGKMPDGSPRNLTVPTHVPWTGGVLGVKVDRSIKWETGLDGMRSSTGEATVLWRAWETFEQNLARGVKPESMGKSWGGK